MKAAALADRRWTLDVGEVHAATIEIAAFAKKNGIQILEITSGGANLEEVFMTILDANSSGPEVDR